MDSIFFERSSPEAAATLSRVRETKKKKKKNDLEKKEKLRKRLGRSACVAWARRRKRPARRREFRKSSWPSRGGCRCVCPPYWSRRHPWLPIQPPTLPYTLSYTLSLPSYTHARKHTQRINVAATGAHTPPRLKIHVHARGLAHITYNMCLYVYVYVREHEGDETVDTERTRERKRGRGREGGREGGRVTEEKYIEIRYRTGV